MSSDGASAVKNMKSWNHQNTSPDTLIAASGDNKNRRKKLKIYTWKRIKFTRTHISTEDFRNHRKII